MGLTISLELRRAQFLRITDKLWLLAVHGFLSGIGNWLEMVFRVPGGSEALRSQPLVQAGVLGLFVVSSLFLIAFGLQSLGVASRVGSAAGGFWPSLAWPTPASWLPSYWVRQRGTVTGCPGPRPGGGSCSTFPGWPSRASPCGYSGHTPG